MFKSETETTTREVNKWEDGNVFHEDGTAWDGRFGPLFVAAAFTLFLAGSAVSAFFSWVFS